MVTIAGVDRLGVEFNANAYSGRLEGGYRLVVPWIGGIGITPYGAAQVTTFDLPACAEQVVSRLVRVRPELRRQERDGYPQPNSACAATNRLPCRSAC